MAKDRERERRREKEKEREEERELERDRERERKGERGRERERERDRQTDRDRQRQREKRERCTRIQAFLIGNGQGNLKKLNMLTQATFCAKLSGWKTQALAAAVKTRRQRSFAKVQQAQRYTAAS